MGPRSVLGRSGGRGRSRRRRRKRNRITAVLPLWVLWTATSPAMSSGMERLRLGTQLLLSSGARTPRRANPSGIASGMSAALCRQSTTADKTDCVALAKTGGESSYTELPTCMEMARDVRQLHSQANNSSAPVPEGLPAPVGYRQPTP